MVSKAQCEVLARRWEAEGIDIHLLEAFQAHDAAPKKKGETEVEGFYELLSTHRANRVSLENIIIICRYMSNSCSREVDAYVKMSMSRCLCQDAENIIKCIAHCNIDIKSNSKSYSNIQNTLKRIYAKAGDGRTHEDLRQMAFDQIRDHELPMFASLFEEELKSVVAHVRFMDVFNCIQTTLNLNTLDSKFRIKHRLNIVCPITLVLFPSTG